LNSRQRIKKIIGGEAADRCGFWLGNPHRDTLPICHKYFGTSTEEELHQKLGSDFRWICPQYMDTTYRHPDGKGIFDLWKHKKSLGEAGPLATCENVEEVEQFDWPNPDYLDFGEVRTVLENAGDYYRASGFWAPFFHDVMDLVGMENYLVKMFTNPVIIHAITARVCGFYLEANERFYRAAGDLVDGYFFGNDFGTQIDLLLTPQQFDDFILPWFRKFIRQAHDHGCQVILHSCGSIHRIIGKLIEEGVNCLHPLQAKARNMDADTLARDFKGQIAFMGGIDTQDLLVHASPAEVKEAVRRVRQLLGPGYIVSPSHEALLPDVPPQNIAAMAEAAQE